MTSDETREVKPSLIEMARQLASKRSACLLVLTGAQAGCVFRLDKQEFMVGRSDGCSIRLEDDGISRNHARIVRDGLGNVTVEDMQSKNGTFCNNERVDRRMLQDGDKLQIGTTTILKFSYQDTIDEQFQRRQYEAATRDVLTRCFNKRYFLERLPSELSHSQRHGQPLSVAMVDIDLFKKLNDTYGHLAGDFVLERVAATMQEQVRAGDVVCRYGGEEFAIIVRDATAEQALVSMQRVRGAVEALALEREGQHIRVTVSIGVAQMDATLDKTPDALLARADSCLYHAKRSGRNRVCITDH